MSITAADFAELSKKRVELAKASKKDSFAQFSINVGGKKAVTSVSHDNLSHDDRMRIDDIKEDVNCNYGDNYSDPFFA